jgi:hypothetical protein
MLLDILKCLGSLAVAMALLMVCILGGVMVAAWIAGV